MLSILYNIIIRPLEEILELIFFFLLKNSDMNIIYSLVGLSLMVNLLSLPLYMKAEHMQIEERETQKKLRPISDHIDKAFSGDERFMMKAAFYRIYHYSPLSVFKGSFSLLLQIPFFTAAYHYLTHLELMKNGSFALISSLGEPDRLFTVAGITLNLLPILMTLINIISGIIYTRGFSLRDKLQVYSLAIVFLILLYNSPSGLVIYWLCNNLFSLLRNIITKYLPRPDIIAAVVYVLAGLMLKNILSALFLIPALILILKRLQISKKSTAASDPLTGRIFILCSIYMSLLAGAWIPLSILSASPADFVNLYNYISPFHYLVTTLSVYIGLFILWNGVIFYFCSVGVRQIYSYIIMFLSFFSTVIFLLSNKDGTISNTLIYSVFPVYKHTTLVILSIPAITILIWLLSKKHPGILVTLCTAMCSTAAFISIKGCFSILSELKSIDFTDAVVYHTADDSSADVTPLINLSRNEKNVVVIMLDKAISGYIPYIFHEKPELESIYDGFTWYPDTASFAGHTNLAFFPLMGGYEYTPSAMQTRKDEPLSQKIDQALKVLPKLFYDNGYSVNLFDIPYAGMKAFPDLSIYKDYTDMNACLLQGRYTSTITNTDIRKTTEHNFIWYSISKLIFPNFQKYIYNDGRWMSTALIDKEILTNNKFLESYAVLDLLPELTYVTDDIGSFTFLDNNTTHDFQMLQMPDYTPSSNIDNSAFFDKSTYEINGTYLPLDTAGQLMTYQPNVAALIRIGEWLEELKKMGVYNNTRIIIVSDHGCSLNQFENLILPDGLDAQPYNALLLVKDFDATGFNVDYSFMTNADVPFLSTEGLINDPINPFTGNPITMTPKAAGIDITTSENYHITDQLLGDNGYAFDTSDGDWYHVNGSLFDPSSWSKK